MKEKHELVDRWIRRGRKAIVLEHGPLGELMVLKEGMRSSPIAYVHMLPATFEGRAPTMMGNSPSQKRG